jgi:hypothetical protein
VVTAVLATWLARASFLLLVGSSILLLGAIGFERTGGFGWVILLPAAWMGALAHGLAWWVLHRVADADPSRRVLDAVGGSAGGLVLGAIAMAVATPAGWTFLFFAFPYAPWLFGPAVFLHARLFHAASGDLPGGSHAHLIRAGSLALAAVALLGIAAQGFFLGMDSALLSAIAQDRIAFRLILWSFFPYPAGLTAVGYALAWWGWSGIAADLRGEEPSRGGPQGAP